MSFPSEASSSSAVVTKSRLPLCNCHTGAPSMARAGAINCTSSQWPSLVASFSPPKSEESSSPSPTESVHEVSVQGDAMQSKPRSNDLFGITRNPNASTASRAQRELHHVRACNGAMSRGEEALSLGVQRPLQNGVRREEDGQELPEVEWTEGEGAEEKEKEEDSRRDGWVANAALLAASSTVCPRSSDPRSDAAVGSGPSDLSSGEGLGMGLRMGLSLEQLSGGKGEIRCLAPLLALTRTGADSAQPRGSSSAIASSAETASKTSRHLTARDADHSRVTRKTTSPTTQALERSENPTTAATSDVDPRSDRQQQQLLQFHCISNNNNTTSNSNSIIINSSNISTSSSLFNIATQTTAGGTLNLLQPSGQRDALRDTLVNTSTRIQSNPSSRQELTIHNTSNIHNLPCDSAVTSIGRACVSGNLLHGTSYFDTCLTQSLSSSILPLTSTPCTNLPEASTTKTSTSTPVSDLVTQVSSEKSTLISPSTPFLHDPVQSGKLSLAEKQTGSILSTSLTPNVETYEETPPRQLQVQRVNSSCVLVETRSSLNLTKKPHFSTSHRQEVYLARSEEREEQPVFLTHEAVIQQQQQQPQQQRSPSTPPTDQSNQKHLENLPQDHQTSLAITTIGRGITVTCPSSSYEPQDTLWQQTKVDHLTQSLSHQTASPFTQPTCNVDSKSSKTSRPLVPNEQLPSKRSPTTAVASHSQIMRMDESISLYESHSATQSTPSTGQQQILPSNLADVHMSSDAINADVTLSSVSSSIDSIDGNGNAIAFTSNTSDHCNNNDLDISNALSHPGPSPYLTSVAVTTSNNLVDAVSFLPSASTTNVNNSSSNSNNGNSSHKSNGNGTNHLTDSAVVDSIVTLPMSSMSPVTSSSVLVTVAPSPTNGDEPSQAIASMVDMGTVDRKADSNILLLPPSPPTPQLADRADQLSASVAPMAELSNSAIDPLAPLTTVTMYAPSPSSSPSLSSTSSSCGKEDFKQSRLKKSTPPVASASSSSTSNINVPVTVTNSVASPAPGKSLKSSTSTTKGKSGMGCGRPGYITCSICSATKYYSHVQRRFGQFSCEPCSKFMKRFLRDPKKFTCFESGNCSIGRPSGEQEPRGVSVSRCKACWLKICLEKFVLESNIREVIEQHYLPVFLTGPSGTSITPSSTLTSSASTTSTNATNASSACTSSNSNCNTSNSSTTGSSSNRSKNSAHYLTASEPLFGESCGSINGSASDEVTGYSSSAPGQPQQPPPLPLPQRKRKPKGQVVSPDHDQSSNIFTSNLNPNPNTVLPPSYSPSSSSISSTASSSLGSAVRSRNARSPRKGPTTVKYKKCEQKPTRNNNSRSNRQNARSKSNAPATASGNSNNNIINSNNSYTPSSHRSNSYTSHQGGYLLTPPADSDNEMDSYVTDVVDEGDSVNLRDTSGSNFIIASSNALFRPIAPCVNTNSNVTRSRAFQGTSKRIRGDGTGVKVKSNSEILTLPYPKSSIASSGSPFAENISPEKMILGKRSRGAKGVIGYNHDHDYGASHETDEVDEEEEEEDDENDWTNNNCSNNVQYSAGSEEDATEDEYDEDEEDEIDEDDSFHRRTIRQRTSTVHRIPRPRNKVSSLRKVSKVNENHVSGSNCANGFTGGNVTAASAIDSCDELIDESYIKSQTDLPEYLATLTSTTSSTSTNTRETTSVTSSSSSSISAGGSRVKKFKSEPESPKAATKAEESIGDLDHSFYSTSDLLNPEIIGEARDFNATPNVKCNLTLSSAKSKVKSSRNATRASGKRNRSQLEQSLPSTSSAFTCPPTAKGPRKTLNSYSNSSTMSNLLSSGGRFVRLKDSTVLETSSRHHLNSLSSTTSSSEFCDFIDYNGNSSSELLHSSTSGHQMLHQIDEDDEGYDDYFDPLVNTAREARDSLFFDEILNTNSPFL